MVLPLLDIDPEITETYFNNTLPDEPQVLLSDQGQLIPLQQRDINIEVFDCGIASIKETLTYLSQIDCTAHYRLPLPPKSALYEFHCKIGDREIRTIVKRKEVAEAEFNRAISEGHTAVKMEAKSSSIFQLSIGNLKANELCVIEFEYLIVLESFGDALELIHPTTLVPPYQSSNSTVTEQLENAEATPEFAYGQPYSINYHLVVNSLNFQRIEVESHPEAQINNSYPGQHELSISNAEAGVDLHVTIELTGKAQSAVHSQRCVRNEEEKKSFLAQFVAPDLSDRFPRKKKEVIFVVDGSGSMSGSPINQAKMATEMFIRDLPTDGTVMFNIVMFGSDHSFWSEKSKLYTAETSAEALCWTSSHINADYGGTEIYSCVNAISKTPKIEGFERVVVFMTDGGVGDSEKRKVVELLSKEKTKYLCLGIGDGVERDLLLKIATACNGKTLFVSSINKIAHKVALLKKCALWESIDQLKLRLEGFEGEYAPKELPECLFHGDVLSIFGRINRIIREPCTITLKGQFPNGEAYSDQLVIDAKPTQIGSVFSILYALNLIAISNEYNATNIAIEEGIVTKNTSRIGVLVQDDPIIVGKTVFVPISLPRSHMPVQPSCVEDMELDQCEGISSYSGSYDDCEECCNESFFCDEDESFISSPSTSSYDTTSFNLVPDLSTAIRCESESISIPSPFKSSSRKVSAPPAAPPAIQHDLASASAAPISIPKLKSAQPISKPRLPDQEALKKIDSSRNAEGYWTLNDQILSVLGIEREKITNECPTGVLLDVWITTLVLAYLNKYLAKERAVWSMMQTKATDWIQKNSTSMSLTQLMSAARKLL